MSVLCLHYPAGIEPAALRALGEACLRLSSQVALRDGEAVFVEAGGSRMLYGMDTLRGRLAALGRRFPGVVAPRLGEGKDAGEALAMARFGGGRGSLSGPPRGRPEALPLAALECHAAPFRADEAVTAALAPLLAALAALGLRTLGDFLGFPGRGLGERFGTEAASLRERLEGRFPVAWPRFEPAPTLDEFQDLRAVDTQSAGPSDEALRFHLKGLCDRMAARLRGRGLRAAGLRLTLGFERVRGLIDAAERSLDLRLAFPLAAPGGLRKLLQERLEAEAARRPLPRPLASLALRVTATAPGFHPQRDAFDRREEEVETLHGLLARLTERLGEDQVFYAQLLQRYLPEQAWRKDGTPPPSPAAGLAAGESVDAFARPRVPRPSRLLKRPLLLTRSGDWLLYWGGTARGKRWRALDWQGPERLGLSWWQGSDFDSDQGSLGRDYWRVRTEAGPDLWVFSREGEETAAGAYWLQGWWG